MIAHGYQKEDIAAAATIAPVSPTWDGVPRRTADDVLAEIVSPEGKPMSGLPNSLCNPPGLVGRIADWISSGAPESPKGLSVFAALTFVSALGARNYLSTTGTPISIYALGIAGTGVGKDWIINAPARLIAACADLKDDALQVFPPERAENGERSCKVQSFNAFNHMNAASNFTSDAALYGALWDSAVLYIRQDEAGDRLKNWNNPQSKEAGIWPIFRECFSDGVLKPRAYARGTSASETTQTLRRRAMIDPAIIFFGVSTPAQFFAAMNADMANDGTINRMVIIMETAPRPTRAALEATFFNKERKENRSVPEDLVREIAKAFTRQITHSSIEGHGIDGLERRFDVFQKPALRQIEWDSAEPRDLMLDYVHNISNEMHDLSEFAEQGDCNRSESAARARIGENAIRLASILAFGDTPGDGTPRVTAEHARWAIAVMDIVKHNLATLVVNHIDNEREELDHPLEKLLRTIDNLIDTEGLVDGAPWASHSSMLQKAQKAMRKPLRCAIDDAVRDEIIEKKKLRPQGKGRASLYYRIL